MEEECGAVLPTLLHKVHRDQREMSEEASTSKSPTQHPRNLVAVDRSAPHRVGMAEGHVPGFEELQGFFREALWALSFVCQKSVILVLRSFLNASLLIGSLRSRKG